LSIWQQSTLKADKNTPPYLDNITGFLIIRGRDWYVFAGAMNNYAILIIAVLFQRSDEFCVLFGGGDNNCFSAMSGAKIVTHDNAKEIYQYCGKSLHHSWTSRFLKFILSKILRRMLSRPVANAEALPLFMPHYRNSSKNWKSAGGKA